MWQFLEISARFSGRVAQERLACGLTRYRSYHQMSETNETPFKAGDLLECIDNAHSSYLTVGNKYKIESISASGHMLYITDDTGAAGCGYYPHRFKLAEQSPTNAELRKLVVGWRKEQWSVHRPSSDLRTGALYDAALLIEEQDAPRTKESVVREWVAEHNVSDEAVTKLIDALNGLSES